MYVFWKRLRIKWAHYSSSLSRKVVGLISNAVIGIFQWFNPSDRTVTLESTQPRKETSTRNICWEKRWPVSKADSLTTYMCRFYWNLGPQLPGIITVCPGLCRSCFTFNFISLVVSVTTAHSFIGRKSSKFLNIILINFKTDRINF